MPVKAGQFTALLAVSYVDMNALPAGVLDLDNDTTNRTGISTSVTTMATSTADVISGRTYRIVGRAYVQQVSAAGVPELHLTGSVTEMIDRITLSSGNVDYLKGEAVVTAGATATWTINLAVKTSAGTLSTFGASVPTRLYIEDLGVL